MTSPNFRPEDVKAALDMVENGSYSALTKMDKARLTAIEERLTKLEGSFDDELQDNRTMKQVIEGMGGKCPDGEFTVNLVSSGEKTDPMDLGHKQSPKVCPVSGMFLEEPDSGQKYWYVDHHIEASEREWSSIDAYEITSCFYIGNCFATREDAERYAKHLKAMAKLRRLGIRETWCVEHHPDDFRLTSRIDRDVWDKLTPEEQNALMWPNEEK